MDKDFKLCPEDCRPALTWEDSCRLCTRGTPFKAIIANFKDHYKPAPKRIPIVSRGTSNGIDVPITRELWDAIKQAYPKGYNEVS